MFLCKPPSALSSGLAIVLRVGSVICPIPALASAYPIDVMFEAEDAANNSSWTKEEHALASSKHYMRAALPQGQTAQELSYDVDIPFAGTYKIWMRVLAQDGASDSVFLSTNANQYGDLYIPATSNEWKWYAVTRALPAGSLQIKIKPRETGTRFGLDRLLVTPLPSFMPSGIGENPAPPPVLPPAGHPRLFLRDTDIPGIRAQLTSAELRPVWDRLRNASAAYSSGALPAVASDKSNYNQSLLVSIKAKALAFILNGDSTSGQQAVTMMNEYLNTVQFIPNDEARARGDTILTSAMVYDWCYGIMDDIQRKYFRDRFVTIATGMEIGFPPNKEGALVGHGSEVLLMRDQLSAAVAFYDEAPAIYQLVAGRFFADYITPRNYSYQALAQHQGVSYGPVRYMADMYAAWIFRRMGAGDVFDPAQQMTPYHWLYMRRPDGQFMRDGDVYQSNYMRYGQYWNEPTAYVLPANYYRDPVLKHQAALDQQAAIDTGSKSVAVDDVFHILFSDTSIAPPTSPPLPLTGYFPAPSGMMVARTGWNDSGPGSGTAIATMKIGNVQYRNHQHLDAGQFQFYYKGGLATASGIYEGLTADCKAAQGYGMAHDMNYHKRTIAHNSMLILDPSEDFQTYANDGGQRWVNPSNRAEPFSQAELLGLPHPDVLFDRYMPVDHSSVVADVLKHEFGPDAGTPDYSYLKGDLTKAYSSKVSDVKRSFVFLNLKNSVHPAALVVFDKVTSTNDSFAKTWLLHSQAQPTITGDTVTITRTDANTGSTIGYNGKLVNRTLLPAATDAVIKSVGGSGMEYLVNGTNYPICPTYANKNTEEAGAWRVEVTPASPRATDTFLNVMQVMDANNGPAPLPTTAIVSEQLVGAQIQDRAVLFAKDGNELASSTSFTLEATSQPVQVLVTDLPAGIWTIGKSGDSAPVQYEVKADTGTAYFTAPTGGTYLLHRGAVSQLP